MNKDNGRKYFPNVVCRHLSILSHLPVPPIKAGMSHGPAPAMTASIAASPSSALSRLHGFPWMQLFNAQQQNKV